MKNMSKSNSLARRMAICIAKGFVAWIPMTSSRFKTFARDSNCVAFQRCCSAIGVGGSLLCLHVFLSRDECSRKIEATPIWWWGKYADLGTWFGWPFCDHLRHSTYRPPFRLES